MLINIVVVQLSMTGVLRIVSGTTFFSNRTTLSDEDSVTLTYTAGHVGDDTNTYSIPSVKWLKNGVQVRIISSDAAVGINGQLISNLSLLESDAGVYQCIFTGARSEIYGTTPLRLDTG